MGRSSPRTTMPGRRIDVGTHNQHTRQGAPTRAPDAHGENHDDRWPVDRWMRQVAAYALGAALAEAYALVNDQDDTTTLTLYSIA